MLDSGSLWGGERTCRAISGLRAGVKDAVKASGRSPWKAGLPFIEMVLLNERQETGGSGCGVLP